MINKHRILLLEQINEKDIVDEEMGNDKYVALTKDTLYFVSIGIASGSYFGKKVKAFPIDKITSVDVGKKILAGYMEITAAGMGGSAHAGAAYTELNENRVFFPKNSGKKFNEIAEKIRMLMKNSKMSISKESEADEIEKLHSLMTKGIITEEEFNFKKRKLLGI